MQLLFVLPAGWRTRSDSGAGRLKSVPDKVVGKSNSPLAARTNACRVEDTFHQWGRPKKAACAQVVDESMFAAHANSCRVEDTLDQWGRPKKITLRMPTEALPEQDRENLPQVEVCVMTSYEVCLMRCATACVMTSYEVCLMRCVMACVMASYEVCEDVKGVL